MSVLYLNEKSSFWLFTFINFSIPKPGRICLLWKQLPIQPTLRQRALKRTWNCRKMNLTWFSLTTRVWISYRSGSEYFPIRAEVRASNYRILIRVSIWGLNASWYLWDVTEGCKMQESGVYFFTTETATSITTLQLSKYSSQFKVITFQFSLFPSSLQNYGLNCELRVKQTKIISNHLKSRFPTNSFWSHREVRFIDI